MSERDRILIFIRALLGAGVSLRQVDEAADDAMRCTERPKPRDCGSNAHYAAHRTTDELLGPEVNDA